MSSGLYSHTTRGTGTVLTAAIYNADHVNHITNQNPTMTGGYADNVAQYQAVVDPGGIGSESLPTNLAGEIERLRFAIKRITGQAQWYAVHTANLANTLNGINPALIAIAAAAGIPLTLRYTDNDLVERSIIALETGDGSGDDLRIKVRGDGANGVSSLAFFIGTANEILRIPETRFRWSAGGYLTPSVGVPLITADAVAATSVWWEPFASNVIPVIKGGAYHMRQFAAMELVLNNPNHEANCLYDVFIDDNAGTLRIGTGPKWTNSGAGTGDRGTGAGTTQISRGADGIWSNAVSMTARNGATTYTIPAGGGTYVGTILIDAVGTVTCHRSWGSNRKWGIWNRWNRHPVVPKCGDSTASWAYGTNTIRASNGDANNRINVIQGLPEDIIEAEFSQKILYNDNPNNTLQMQVGIGINSTTVFSGRIYDLIIVYNVGTNSNHSGTPIAHAKHILGPVIGLTQIQALERTPQAGSSNDYFGTETNMLLTARCMA